MTRAIAPPSAVDPPAWLVDLAQQIKLIEPGTILPTGVIVGSASIEKVTRAGEFYQWHLVDARRAKSHLKPRRHPQPVWFRPFWRGIPLTKSQYSLPLTNNPPLSNWPWHGWCNNVSPMIWMWIGFIAFVLGMLGLDLGVFNRKAHVIGVKEALKWSAFWIALGLSFSIFVFFAYQNHWLGIGLAADGSVRVDPIDKVPLAGHSATVKYLTGYVIEKSLSVDNIFVIALIFAYFGVPAMYQHRVLFWGILGALMMRGMMIWLGAELIYRYHWIIWVFGAFLIFTGIRMIFMDTEHGDPAANPILKLVRRFFPVTEQYHGQHFVVGAGSNWSQESATPGEDVKPDAAVEAAKTGALMLTPLALALIMVETTDLIFAVDSIPAIFAITGDPFIVYTSNVFAILGLRSLYFALAGMIDKFRYLKFSLAVVLTVVGIKMLAADFLKKLIGEHFNVWLLVTIFAILGTGVIASMIANRRERITAETQTQTT